MQNSACDTTTKRTTFQYAHHYDFFNNKIIIYKQQKPARDHLRGGDRLLEAI